MHDSALSGRRPSGPRAAGSSGTWRTTPSRYLLVLARARAFAPFDSARVVADRPAPRASVRR